MFKVVVYLILVLAIEILALKYRTNISFFLQLEYSHDFKSAFFTLWSAVLGSTFYCLRAVYESICIRKRWDKDWEIWYYLRPLTGAIIGIGVWLALKSGVLILTKDPNSINIWPSCFVGFVAGMNVKNMQKLIEKIAKNKTSLQESNQTKNG